MAVPFEVVNKIKEYEAQGYSPDEIVQGMAQSEKYPDLAKKVQAYQSQYSAQEILDGIKSAEVDTSNVRYFRGFTKSGQPIISEEKPQMPDVPGVVAKEKTTLEKFLDLIPGSKVGPETVLREKGKLPKQEPGLYSENETILEKVGKFLTPFSGQLYEGKSWRSPEAFIEAAGWIGGSKIFRDIMKGIAGTKAVAPKNIKEEAKEIIKKAYQEAPQIIGEKEAVSPQIIEDLTKQRADAALKTPGFLRTAEDLIAMKEAQRIGPVIKEPSMEKFITEPKIEIPVTLSGKRIEGHAGDSIGIALKSEGEKILSSESSIPKPSDVLSQAGLEVGKTKVIKDGIERVPLLDNGKVVGGINVRITDDEIYIPGILSAGGVGSRAIEAFKKFADETGRTVRAGSGEMSGSYWQKMGFVQDGRDFVYVGKTDKVPAEQDIQQYSKEKLRQIEAAKDHPEYPYHPTIDFYLEGTTPEVIVKSGKVPYQAVLPKEMYDLDKDELGLVSKALQIVRQSDTPGDVGFQKNVLHTLMKDAGYSGYQKDGIAFVFGKQPENAAGLVFKEREPGLWLGQVGKVNPQILSDIASSSVGAATGAAVDEDNRIRGAVIGGASGFTISRAAFAKLLGGKKPPLGTKIHGDQVEIPPIKEGPLTEPTLRTDIHKEVSTSATKSMLKEGIKRDPNKLMSEQIMEEIRLHPENYENILKAYNTTTEEFLRAFDISKSQWARNLGLLGWLSKKIQGPEAEKLRKALGENYTAWDELQHWWKKVDNVRRGLLVTQLSTAIRNVTVQGSRLGLDIFEQGLNAGLQRLFNTAAKDNPLDGLETFLRLFQRNKGVMDKILKMAPTQYDRMFAQYSSDVASATGKNIQKAVDVANFFNRFQEFLTRRAVFMGKLDQKLARKGIDLAEAIEKNNLKAIDLDDIRFAVGESLDFTFATQPKWGSIGQKFVSFINAVPGASFILPFPRFMVNSLKFNFEYSPLGLLKLLSKQERQAFAEGNVRVLSRAILGSALLGAAWQFRNSDYAGEKWYELKTPDGTIVDMRPYNPFGAYLFVADLAKKYRENSLYKMNWNDIAQGIGGVNLRAGVGLWAVDKLLNELTVFASNRSWEKAKDIGKQFAGEVVGGFVTPLNMVREFLEGFDESIVRERKTEPFLGPIKSKIPGLAETLPEAYAPTREGPVKSLAPAFRQMTGISARPAKNPLESELDRLGFERRNILPSTGNVRADRLIAEKMGFLAEKVAPFFNSPGYKRLSDPIKGMVLQDILKDIRDDAREWAEALDPQLFQELEMEKIPKWEKLLLQEKGVIQ
jgi:hypothetical protein